MGRYEQLIDQLQLPIVGALLFIVSDPELAIAQCKSGFVGSFPALNARPASVLGNWLVRIKDELRDFGHAAEDIANFFSGVHGN